MHTKRTSRKVMSKSPATRKCPPVSRPKMTAHHYRFLGIIVLFCGISLYALLSFFSSTNNYINGMYSSVVGDPNVVAIEEQPLEQQPVPVGIFTDVDSTHINAEAIDALYKAGVVNGYTDGTFRPANTINRAELLTVLTNATDADFAGKAYGNCFKDVTDQWFSVFVCYSKEAGWVNGFSDNSYRPGKAVNRAEALKTIFVAFSYPPCESVSEDPYSDVKADAWFAPYVCAARKDEILPVSAGSFAPASNITRADVVQIIYNVMVRKGLLK